MIAFLTKWSQYRGLRLDRSSHKMIRALFFRIAIIIAVLIKCTITKMSYFWVFLWLWPWSQSSLLGLRPWSQYSKNVKYLGLYEDCDHGRSDHKIPYFWVYVRTATMIVVLTKWPISECVLVEDCDREHKQNEIYKKVDPKKQIPWAPPPT